MRSDKPAVVFGPGKKRSYKTKTGGLSDRRYKDYETKHVIWQTVELILLTENGVQSVPQFPEMFRKILRAFRSYFPVAVDGGIEGEHDTVINVFRVLTVKAVPGNQLAVVQQLQYSVSAAQHLSLRYALILIFFIYEF